MQAIAQAPQAQHLFRSKSSISLSILNYLRFSDIAAYALESGKTGIRIKVLLPHQVVRVTFTVSVIKMNIAL